MTNRTVYILMLVVVLVVAGFGCSSTHDNMMSPDDTIVDAILRVTPADGATDISPSTSIAVTFSRAMDTMLVIDNMFITYGPGMRSWLDSASHYGGIGMMSQSHMDHMMVWMDTLKMPGEFHWNEAKDSCEFVLDAGLMANEEHMILICEADMMMSGGGMMGGDQNNTEFSEHHFMTGQ